VTLTEENFEYVLTTFDGVTQVFDFGLGFSMKDDYSEDRVKARIALSQPL
jgi:hypothetical protein